MPKQKPVSDNTFKEIVWPRSTDKEMEGFNPATKRCTANCGQHRLDPRSPEEFKFQCYDCEPVEVLEIKLPTLDMLEAAMQTKHLTAREIMAQIDAAQLSRQDRYPTVQTCLDEAAQIMQRLKDMGWRDICYAPKDGTYFKAICFGATQPQTCCYIGKSIFAASGGDWWPETPVLFKPMVVQSAPE